MLTKNEIFDVAIKIIGVHYITEENKGQIYVWLINEKNKRFSLLKKIVISCVNYRTLRPVSGLKRNPWM